MVNGALALGFTWVNDRYPNLTFLLPVGGMLLSILFLSLDSRNRELFDACVAAGVELEQPGTGVYTKLNAKSHAITHSKTFDLAIWVWTFILGAATVLLFVRIWD